jgi:2-oxoisovalerate dehydrogenase E2 component (dihydrolipoyl transacylase)
VPESDTIEEIKVVGLRRQIAERMQNAKRRIPHFSYVEETDVTTLEELRAQLNGNRSDAQPKLSLLPFLVMALARSVSEFPQMNARYDDDAGIIRRHSAVHIGIATQTERGLLVPVVRHAEQLDIWGVATEIARLAEVARAGKAKLDELTGATITITSLGALGGVVSTPVINYPEVAIIGVNRIITRPVFIEERVVPRKLMNLSSSFDHRVVDGFDAARFIQRIRAFIEFPSTIFISS